MTIFSHKTEAIQQQPILHVEVRVRQNNSGIIVRTDLVSV